jgi:signal peptidase II
MATRPVDRLLVLVAVATCAADLAAKAAIHATLRECVAPPVAACDRVDLLGPFGLLHTGNRGIALGIVDGPLAAVIVAGGLVLLVLLWRVTPCGRPGRIALGLVSGGVVANLVDRLVAGRVTDFIDLRWGTADRGLVLNLADLALFAGAVALTVLLVTRSEPADTRAGEPPPLTAVRGATAPPHPPVHDRG